MRKFRMLIIVAAVGLVLLWLLAGGEGPSIEGSRTAASW